MATKVKIELNNTKMAIKTLKNFDKILGAVAEDTKGKIIKLWLKGFGANGKRMKGLTKKYRDKKILELGTGKRDLFGFGKGDHMQEAFSVRKLKRFRWVLGWQERRQLDKARGNTKHAPGMLSVGKKLEQEAINNADKLYWKQVNSVR
jgi:hypothetical protein